MPKWRAVDDCSMNDQQRLKSLITHHSLTVCDGQTVSDDAVVHNSCLTLSNPGETQTMSHILSNPVPWQHWMAAYLGYTLWMKTLFCGWPVMVHDTHMRRRRSKPHISLITEVHVTETCSSRTVQTISVPQSLLKWTNRRKQELKSTQHFMEPIGTNITAWTECQQFTIHQTKVVTSKNHKQPKEKSTDSRRPAIRWGLTSHSTHYRSSQRRLYGSDDPTNSVTALKDDG